MSKKLAAERDRLKAMPVGLFCNPEALSIHAEALADVTTLEQAHETIKRLNRRVQRAEKAALENIAECRRQGVGLGRALAGFGYAQQEEKNAVLRKALGETITDMQTICNLAIDDPTIDALAMHVANKLSKLIQPK